jgi:methionine-rich copper-binding protein CopC
MVTTYKTSPPKLTSINNSTVTVGKEAVISLTFDKPIEAGSGSIKISNGSDIHIIPMTDSQVTINNQTLTITPANLLPNSHYSISILANAIQDLAGNAYGETNSIGLGFNTIDTKAPTLKLARPANTSTEVGTQVDIILTFSEVVKAGTGNLVISNGTDIRTISITDKSQVTFNNSKIIINPTEDLQSNSHYNVKISATAIQDFTGNKYAGIKNDSSLNFFTMSDKVLPKLLSTEPSKGDKLVNVDSNITFTFDEPIQTGTGNLLLSNGLDNRTIPVTDSAVTIAGNKLILNPATDLTGGGVYNVLLDAGAIKDKAGNAFAGISSETALSFSPIDKIAPMLLSVKPSDDSFNVTPSRNLVLTFNENVKVGSGDIEISNGITTTKIAITDKSQVSINKNVVTINPKTDFATDSHYNVQFAAGVLKDSAENVFTGINDATTFNFSTIDKQAPILLSTTPTDDGLNVAKNSNLVLTFNENVKANVGNIEIRTGSTTKKIPINDKSQVTINKNVITINPKNDFVSGSDYNVQFAKGVVKDILGNAFSGITDETLFNFSIADTVAPKLVSSKPIDNNLNVARSSTVVLTFDENVKAGSGSFIISDGTDIRTIPVEDTLIRGKIVTITPTEDLNPGKTYSVTAAKGIVKDAAGNDYAGISDKTTLNFTTETVVSSGSAIDGYLAFSTVFADANGNGVLDAGEANTKTNAKGVFSLSNGVGSLVTMGGTDLTTGLAFKGILKAPAGSTVITPLTTVVEGIVKSGKTLDEAQDSVIKAFNLSEKTDLLTNDPIAASKAAVTPAEKTAAANVMAKTATVVNFLVTTTEVLKGAGGDKVTNEKSNSAVISALVGEISKNADKIIDFSNKTLVKSLLNNSATTISENTTGESKNFAAKIAIAADTVASVVKDATDNVNAAVAAAKGNSVSLLAGIGSVSKFAQGGASDTLQKAVKAIDPTSATATSTLNKLETSLTGDSAKNSIAKEAANIVAVTTPSVETPVVVTVTQDTTPPNLTITSNLTTVKIGETATVTFTFSESPKGFSETDIEMTDGWLKGFAVSSSDDKIYSAIFSPFSSSTSAARISVASGTYTDVAGNKGKTDSALAINIDTSAQVAADKAIKDSQVAIALAEAQTQAANQAILDADKTPPTLTISSDVEAVKIGETATITLTFSESPVNFFADADIVITGGTLGKMSESGLIRTATFTPSLESILTASIIVAEGAYTDASGNNGGSGTTTIKVDTVTPSIAIASNLSTVKIGETSLVNFTFNKTPIGFTAADIATTGGILTGLVVDSSNNKLYTATFTPTANATSLASITVAAGNYADSVGNKNITSLKTIIADTVAPTLTISSDLSAVKIGETATVTFTFNEAVVGFTASDIVTTGGTLANLAINSSDNTIYTATFTPNSTSTTAASISVASATYTDIAGNTGGVGLAKTIGVDTIAPTLVITNNLSTVTFTFSEAPTGFTAADIVTTGGTLTGLAVNSSDNKIYTATFTPTVASSFSTAGVIAVVAATYTDAAGNTGGSATTPTLTLTALSDTNLSASETPNYSQAYAATDSDGIANTVAVVKNSSGVTDTGATLTTSGGVVAGNLSALSDGTYTVEVTTTDTAGNSTVAKSSSFIVDQTAPTVVGSPADNEVISNPPSSIVLTFDETVVTGSGVITIDNVTRPVYTVTNTFSSISNSTTITVTPTGLRNGYDYELSIPDGFVKDTAGNPFISSTLHFTVENGSLTSPAITETDGNDILSGNQGNVIEDTSVVYNAAEGNDIYVLDLTTSANVSISGFGSGDTLVFNVPTIADGLTDTNAFYGVSDDGTDIQLIAVTDEGNVQVVTFVGLSDNVNPSSVGNNIDTISELNTFLTSIEASIDFI